MTNEQADAANATSSAGRRRSHVLILDDDPFALKLLSSQLRAFNLERRGYADLIACERGQAAVELLEKPGHGIGLVFCDLQMPEMDGIEFVRNLVRVGYVGAVVLVSGENERILATAERFARAHGLNVAGAMQKPVEPERLRAALDAARREIAAVGHGHGRRSYSAAELAAAIDSHQLVNYYQPKVDLVSGALVGLEALVRWQHPEDGLVMPFGFIGLAEQSGLIGALTESVLVRSLRAGRRWRDQGLELDISVNVSMGTLSSLAFPDEVAGHAGKAGFPMDRLVLEITESQLMTDPRMQLDILTRLSLKHVRLSIDDFGTGYSSLAQLRDLPFAELKIDRGFVHRASGNPSLRAILEANLGMARQLRMKTVAEGVEEKDDWTLLRELGCDQAQGYLVARPMPAEAVIPWSGHWQARYRALAEEDRTT